MGLGTKQATTLFATAWHSGQGTAWSMRSAELQKKHYNLFYFYFYVFYPQIHKLPLYRYVACGLRIVRGREYDGCPGKVGTRKALL